MVVLKTVKHSAFLKLPVVRRPTLILKYYSCSDRRLLRGSGGTKEKGVKMVSKVLKEAGTVESLKMNR